MQTEAERVRESFGWWIACLVKGFDVLFRVGCSGGHLFGRNIHRFIVSGRLDRWVPILIRRTDTSYTQLTLLKSPTNIAFTASRGKA